MRHFRLVLLGGALAAALALAACGEDDVQLSGSVRVDGSGTVAPLTKAVARRFMREHPGVRVSVGTAGARPGLAELPVANDAVILVANRDVPVRCLTTRQLEQIWHGNSEVTDNWAQIDGLDPPYEGELVAWGPGTDTEPFAFFTKAVNHTEGETRDYNNVLHKLRTTTEMVAGVHGALGYVEYRFYREDPEDVGVLAVDSGRGCVAPTPRTIANGTFAPLSRRLGIALSVADAARPATQAFLRFYLDEAATVARQLGFVPLTDEQRADSRARLDELLAPATS